MGVLKFFFERPPPLLVRRYRFDGRRLEDVLHFSSRRRREGSFFCLRRPSYTTPTSYIVGKSKPQRSAAAGIASAQNDRRRCSSAPAAPPKQQGSHIQVQYGDAAHDQRLRSARAVEADGAVRRPRSVQTRRRRGVGDPSRCARVAEWGWRGVRDLRTIRRANARVAGWGWSPRPSDDPTRGCAVDGMPASWRSNAKRTRSLRGGSRRRRGARR